MTTQNLLIQEIDTIDISHMYIHIEPNEYLVEDEYASKKLALALVQTYYKENLYRILQTTPGYKTVDDISMELKKKSLVYAKWAATKRSSTVLNDIVDGATLHLLDDANKTGWYKHLADKDSGEFDTLEELLASLIDQTEQGDPKGFNLTFMVKELLPLARTFKLDADAFLVSSLQTKKVASLVPAARHCLKMHEEKKIKTRKAKKDLEWMLQLSADASVKSGDFARAMQKYRGITKTYDPLIGEMYILGKNRVLMVIDTDNEGFRKMVERALSNRVDFRLRDISNLLQKLLPESEQNNKFAVSRLKTLIERILNDGSDQNL